jgi:hypothetical protein
MMEFPRTENALVVRTDFSNTASWDALCTAIQEPVGAFQFRAYVDFLSNPDHDGISPEQLRSLIPEHYKPSFIFIVDHVSLTHPDHPILVVDLSDEPGRTFRVIPSAMWSVENNLSVANMGFEEFVGAVDRDGVFRDFPQA